MPPATPGAAAESISDFVHEQLQQRASDFLTLAGWLALEIAIVRLLGLIAMKRVSHIKR